MLGPYLPSALFTISSICVLQFSSPAPLKRVHHRTYGRFEQMTPVRWKCFISLSLFFLYSSALVCVRSLFTISHQDEVGVNTVNHMWGRRDVVLRKAEERVFAFFPCHVRARASLFITNLTPHDGYILLSLIVMKCKPSPERGDN